MPRQTAPEYLVVECLTRLGTGLRVQRLEGKDDERRPSEGWMALWPGDWALWVLDANGSIAGDWTEVVRVFEVDGIRHVLRNPADPAWDGASPRGYPHGFEAWPCDQRTAAQLAVRLGRGVPPCERNPASARVAKDVADSCWLLERQLAAMQKTPKMVLGRDGHSPRELDYGTLGNESRESRACWADVALRLLEPAVLWTLVAGALVLLGALGLLHG